MWRMRAKIRGCFRCLCVIVALILGGYYVILYAFTSGGLPGLAMVSLRRFAQTFLEDTLMFTDVCVTITDKDNIKHTDYRKPTYYYNMTSYGDVYDLNGHAVERDATRRLHVHVTHRFSNERYGGEYTIFLQAASEQPSVAGFSDKVAVIPLFNAKSFHFTFYDFLPSLFGLMGWAKERGYISESSQSELLFSRDNKGMSPLYTPIYTALGISNVRRLNESHGMCYKTLIMGRQQFRSTFAEIGDFLSRKWGLSGDVCAANQVAIIQRQQRRVLNEEQIRETFVKHGYVNTDIVSLEGLTLQQQLQIMRCTRVLVGVQGAGLTWFVFLPPGAALIEITYHNWPVRYGPRANNERPDIRTHTIYCDISIPDSAHAYLANRWYKYDGPITEEMKERVMRTSESFYRRHYYPFGVPMSVWKVSDCQCSCQLFTKILENSLRLE